MAEIKSSIEIAMEKTKHLVLDEEGRRSLREKELRDRVSATIRRFMAELVDTEGFLKEFGDIGAERERKESIFLDIVLEEYDLSSKNERLLSLFTLLKSERLERFKERLEIFQKRCDEEMEKRKMIARARIEDRLKQEGIWGDSVEPNLQAFEEWKTEEREVLDLLRKWLKEQRKDLEKTA
jgi:hypothetical protein